MNCQVKGCELIATTVIAFTIHNFDARFAHAAEPVQLEDLRTVIRVCDHCEVDLYSQQVVSEATEILRGTSS